MRTTKYRAWYPKEKKMIDPVLIVGGIGVVEGHIAELKGDGFTLNRGQWGVPFTIESPEGVVMMEYTGLKDKKGKEIKEGDIVEYMPLSSYGAPFGKARNVVKYKAPEFEFVPYKDKRWGGYKNLKVIGNIYEDKKLLKQT